MAYADSVGNILTRSAVEYRILNHPRVTTLEQAAESVGVVPEQVARAVVLQDRQGYLMVILPLSGLIDFTALQDLTQRNLTPASLIALRRQFPDCEHACVPPLGQHYGIETLIDETLASAQTVYFEPGSHTALVALTAADFLRLNDQAGVRSFVRSELELGREPRHDFLVPEDASLRAAIRSLAPIRDIRQIVRDVQALPPMPDMAHKLLKLRNEPTANARDLAAIVERDPSLAAQIIRYARSPFFGYRGRIDSIQQAISRVLGFETVMNVTLGIAAGRGFRTSPEGPLGLYAFWRHAVYSAALMQILAGILPRKIRPRPGIAYLAGLLHNLGFPLFGHLFPPNFFVLNKLVEANPDVPVGIIELRVLGNGEDGNGHDVNHAQLGAWLMESWDMPEEIIVAVREHHDEYYRGAHAVLANLALITDQLLKRYGMGDAPDGELSRVVLTVLGLDEAMAESLAERVVNGGDQLEQMSRTLAA